MAMKHTGSPRRVLVCAPLVPDFDRESGSRRIVDFVEFLQEEGYDVTFLAGKPGHDERYVGELQQRGVETYIGLDSRAERTIASRQFPLAVIAFWSLAESWMATIRRLSPTTRIVVDSLDLHFVRNARKVFQHRGTAGHAAMLGSEDAANIARELNTYAAADGVLAVSAKEAALINDLVGDRNLAHSVGDCEELCASQRSFADRNGILFIGNFRHTPNVDAVNYLCNLVLPQLSMALTAEHPTYIVGNALDRVKGRHRNTLSHVRMVGWVPSVVPYLEQSRISVLPLLYGAGTKRKLIQTLMVGTPAVSTSVGIEGLDLRDGEHVLVADDPASFARCVTRLLSDEGLWQHLSHQGREHVRRIRSRDLVKRSFIEALTHIEDRQPKSRDLADIVKLHRRGFDHPYDRVTHRIQDVVRDSLPVSSTVLVVSKGDDDLLDLGGRKAWHFPRSRNGQYAGHYPATSQDAIDHLEALRMLGADFLVLPATSLWWLDHYVQFAQHLRHHYRLMVSDPDTCMIFALREGPEVPEQTEIEVAGVLSPELLGPSIQKAYAHLASSTSVRNMRHTGAPERQETVLPPEVQEPGAATESAALDPLISEGPARLLENTGDFQMSRSSLDEKHQHQRPTIGYAEVVSGVVGSTAPKSALVLGIYLADRDNHITDIVSSLSSAKYTSVAQRWVALNGEPPNAAVGAVTVGTLFERKSKYELLNRLLAGEDLSQFDYVVTMDDDILLPHDFIDSFLTLQAKLDFAVAQPARTSDSYIDFPIVEQQRGVLARQTLLVEIGPVVSFHRSAYDLVFPFDMTSAMGWGYESIWAYRSTLHRLKQGIIDATPVSHSLRGPAAHYDWGTADAERASLLRKHRHVPLEKCFKVLDIVTSTRTESWIT